MAIKLFRGNYARDLKNIGTSENYQNGLLKVLISFAEYLGPEATFIKFKIKKW